MIKNKHGDIPVTILVIAVIAIFSLTIFSFIKVSSDLNKDFLGIGLIETMLSVEEENIFSSTTDFTTEHSFVFEKEIVLGIFNRDYIIISANENSITGIYFKGKPDDCGGEWWEFWEECGEIVKVIYGK
ncbi:hypothetical protein J4407_01860 [Candidatus Pacearchaeota archaeon]|nr:hypothetical protein [Candidatus Pacearchaeota archaeon]